MRGGDIVDGREQEVENATRVLKDRAGPEIRWNEKSFNEMKKAKSNEWIDERDFPW